MPEGDEHKEQPQSEPTGGETGGKDSNRNRLIIGYAVVSSVILAIAVAVFIIASSGGGSNGPDMDEGGAHINLNTQVGSTNGVQPDERAGIVPPPPNLTNLQAAAKRAECILELHLGDQGHEHIPPGSPTPNYNTNPPASGPHVEPPYQQADGAYSEEPEPIDFVHSLEHGRMEIQYSPKLPERAQLELKGLYDTMYGATLLFPNPEFAYKVAVTSWTNLMTCFDYRGPITLDAIRAFGKATWGKYGGEPVFAFTFTGPTPAQPEEPERSE